MMRSAAKPPHAVRATLCSGSPHSPSSPLATPPIVRNAREHVGLWTRERQTARAGAVDRRRPTRFAHAGAPYARIVPSGPPPIGFEACFNFRDVGGHETHDGRRLKLGAVYRSDSLHRLTPADLETAARLGVRTVIDMRSSGDVQRHGRYAGADDIAYHHLPWYEDDTRPFELSKPGDPAPDVARTYVDMTAACKDAVAAAFQALADEEHAIVVHCVAGKDRTGIVAALLLSILGVPDASIVHDYQLTDGAAARMRAWAEVHSPEVVSEIETTPDWVLRAPATTMEAFLRLVRDDYGSVEALLTHLGIHEITTSRLRRRLLEP